MGVNGVNQVWVGVFGYASECDVRVASTVKGLADEIGASYSTMKSKAVKGGKFMIAVDGGGSIKVWWIVRQSVKKVAGRGNKSARKGGFEVMR